MKEYRYVTPKYMKEFVVKPPCKRPPLALGQTVDPRSIRRGEDLLAEWAKHQAKLKKWAQKAVEEFNRSSKASAKAGASASASAPKKAMQKKPAQKPKPSAPKPLVVKPSSSKASAPKDNAQSSAPPTATSSLVATAKASMPVVLASCQGNQGFPTANIAASSASASGHTSSNTPKLKIKATAGHGIRPNPKSKVVVPQPDESNMADEDEFVEFIQRRAEHAAIAKNSLVPLVLDPKKILDLS
nr:uncharacterized protein LOC109740730 [Aegilops tauschii subsp. strangulata]